VLNIACSTHGREVHNRVLVETLEGKRPPMYCTHCVWCVLHCLCSLCPVFECGVLFCVMCYLCVVSYCSTLPPGKNPFAI
jgi:hypothetical protein